MKTAQSNNAKYITKTLNRRISALLACILFFQTIFSGVEVRAEQADTVSASIAPSVETVMPVSTQPVTQTPVPYPDQDYTLTMDKTGAWGGYAQYNITITNTSSVTLEDIALALPWQDADIDAIWCATAEKQDGVIYILPLEWCENLAPGASLAFGMIVKGDDNDLVPPEKHALITVEQVNAIKSGKMQTPF